VNGGIADTTRLLQRDGVVTRDQVSQLLHGPVQGRLAAVAMALQMHLAARRHGRQPPVAVLREHAGTPRAVMPRTSTVRASRYRA
jgi:hypothetical protein